MEVCHFIDHLDGAGGQKVVLDIIKNTDDANISYTVCYLKEKDIHSSLKPDFEEAGVQVKGFKATRPFDPAAVYRMLRFFRRERFDVLHTHTVYAQVSGRVVSRLTNINHCISTYHMVSDFWYPNPVMRILERRTRSIDDLLIAVSDGVRNTLADGTDENWCTIYNGINVSEYNDRVNAADTRSLVREYELGDNDLVFVNIGRFTRQKSQSDLIRAMAIVVEAIPDAKLFIIGGGELEGRFERLVDDLGLQNNVIVLGRVPSVIEYYALADVFVQSSIGEGLPLVLLEAMAAELPIIATDIRGVNEAVVDGTTGLLVPPNDPTALAEAMIEMDSERRRERCGSRGYELAVETFDIGEMVDSYTEVYYSLVDGNVPV